MTVPILDPFGAARDPTMLFLEEALDPPQAEERLTRLLEAPWRLREIRIVRYKPQTRCLVEYDLVSDRSDAITVLGKAAAWGLDVPTYRIYRDLWRQGFSDASGDGVSIPEPLGMIPEFHMWFQRKVPGALAGDLLHLPGGVKLAGRIADAVHKLHLSNIPTPRHHTMQAELDVLHKRLAVVAESRPEWAARLEDLLAFCDRLGASVPEPEPSRVHRDLYQDHVIVNGRRLYVLDLDLYARGDAAVDAGNFLAHLMEWGLRGLGNPDALADPEAAFERRFLELAGADRGPAVRAYRFLSLVRLISISTVIPDRRAFTEPILRLCEAKHRELAAVPA